MRIKGERTEGRPDAASLCRAEREESSRPFAGSASAGVRVPRRPIEKHARLAQGPAERLIPTLGIAVGKSDGVTDQAALDQYEDGRGRPELPGDPPTCL